MQTNEEARTRICELLYEAYEIARAQKWTRRLHFGDELSITVDTTAPQPQPGTTRKEKDA